MHHNALQCTAMHCNAAMHWQCMAMHCSAYSALGLCTRVPQCTKTIAVHCGAFKLMMHCFAFECITYSRPTMHCDTLNSVVHWCIALHWNTWCIALHFAALHTAGLPCIACIVIHWLPLCIGALLCIETLGALLCILMHCRAAITNFSCIAMHCQCIAMHCNAHSGAL